MKSPRAVDARLPAGEVNVGNGHQAAATEIDIQHRAAGTMFHHPHPVSGAGALFQGQAGALNRRRGSQQIFLVEDELHYLAPTPGYERVVNRPGARVDVGILEQFQPARVLEDETLVGPRRSLGQIVTLAGKPLHCQLVRGGIVHVGQHARHVSSTGGLNPVPVAEVIGHVVLVRVHPERAGLGFQESDQVRRGGQGINHAHAAGLVPAGKTGDRTSHRQLGEHDRYQPGQQP
jgi:hypothetical protein